MLPASLKFDVYFTLSPSQLRLLTSLLHVPSSHRWLVSGIGSTILQDHLAMSREKKNSLKKLLSESVSENNQYSVGWLYLFPHGRSLPNLDECSKKVLYHVQVFYLPNYK